MDAITKNVAISSGSSFEDTDPDLIQSCWVFKG